MRVLAIDCSAKSVSVAIGEEGKIIAEGFLNITLTHSETLMPLINQTLTNSKLSLKDIDAFAISQGPGSFTGIRIGISALKGLAFGDNKPIYGFSTLDAMALTFTGFKTFNCIICPLMDARRNQFYNALFRLNNGKIQRLTDDRAIPAENLFAELKEKYSGEKIMLLGDGAELFQKLTQREDNISLAPEGFSVQRALGMAVICSQKECNLKPLSPEEIMPIYLRPSQAERERAEKLKSN